jgi:hypothetical protein
MGMQVRFNDIDSVTTVVGSQWTACKKNMLLYESMSVDIFYAMNQHGCTLPQHAES